MPKDIDKIKASSEDNARPTCSLCGRYTDRKTSPQCTGHGGGGGGGTGSTGELSTKSESTEINYSSGHSTNSVIRSVDSMASQVGAHRNLEIQSNHKPFNSEVISDLLSIRLLLIDNDRELGTLTVKLLCNPNHLTADQSSELKKFIDTILKKLKKFKNENNLLNSCSLIEQDKEGNILSLRIALPTPSLYDTFIQRLADENLLPLQIIEQKTKERVAYKEGVNHFHTTPLSSEPAVSSDRKVEKSEAQKLYVRPKSPLDGLKPK